MPVYYLKEFVIDCRVFFPAVISLTVSQLLGLQLRLFVFLIIINLLIIISIN